MKKMTCLLMLALAIFCLAGCTRNTSALPKEEGPTAPAQSAPTTEPSSEPTSEPKPSPVEPSESTKAANELYEKMQNGDFSEIAGWYDSKRFGWAEIRDDGTITFENYYVGSNTTSRGFATLSSSGGRGVYEAGTIIKPEERDYLFWSVLNRDYFDRQLNGHIMIENLLMVFPVGVPTVGQHWEGPEVNLPGMDTADYRFVVFFMDLEMTEEEVFVKRRNYAETNQGATSFEVNPVYLRRSTAMFSALIDELGILETEASSASRFTAWKVGINVFYELDQSWLAEGICIYVQAPLGVLVPEMPQSMSLADFTAGISETYSNVEVLRGAGTAGYIADKYARVEFGGRDEHGGGFTASFEIMLDASSSDNPNDIIITRDSIAWLRFLVG